MPNEENFQALVSWSCKVCHSDKWHETSSMHDGSLLSDSFLSSGAERGTNKTSNHNHGPLAMACTLVTRHWQELLLIEIFVHFLCPVDLLSRPKTSNPFALLVTFQECLSKPVIPLGSPVGSEDWHCFAGHPTSSKKINCKITAFEKHVTNRCKQLHQQTECTRMDCRPRRISAAAVCSFGSVSLLPRWQDANDMSWTCIHADRSAQIVNMWNGLKTLKLTETNNTKQKTKTQQGPGLLLV